MTKRGPDNHFWRHGRCSGWNEYRYGSRRVTLAPIFKEDRRKHIVMKVMDILRDRRESPFEKEGPARAGLRSALCLQGYGWSRSDAEAASVVAEGLNILGAVRPTWEQGQREYTTAPENCSWCGVPVPEEYLVTQRRTRYCSDVCARSAVHYRDFRARHHSDEGYAAALDIINRSRNPICTCEECGKKFRPYHARNPGKYCSPACRDGGRRVEPTERECAQCGKLFIVKKGDEKFCSQACYWKADRDQVARECIWCHRPFMALSAKAMLCSGSCRSMYYAVSSGRLVPKRITPPVFDYVFRMAA